MSIHALCVPFGKVAVIKAGYPFRGSIEGVHEGPVRAVQMKDMDPVDGVRWQTVVRTRLTGRREADWLLPGDLLFVSRGSRFYAACLDAPPEHAVCGQHLFHVRVKPGSAVVPAFLAWQINQPPFQRELRRTAEGSSQLSLRRPVLEALPITVPSEADQQRIVKLVRLAQRERELQARLIRNHERLFESIAEELAVAAA
jgi:hypothetical protein